MGTRLIVLIMLLTHTGCQVCVFDLYYLLFICITDAMDNALASWIASTRMLDVIGSSSVMSDRW
jgi:hypothetical protein